MNIYKIRQRLDEIERLRASRETRHGITEQDIQDDIEYQKSLIRKELESPVKINFQEAPTIFKPEDFEEMRA